MPPHYGKFIAYFRVSTDRQGKSGLGLAAQREAVMSYLDGGRWALVDEFTEIESGKRNDRLELVKALAACKKQKAKLVIAKLDRLSRRDFNAYYDIEEVKPIDGATWKLELAGLIKEKRPWTAQHIYELPEQELIIRHICVEGWDYIGQWSGPNLRAFLTGIGADLTARYVYFICNDDFTESIDMTSALHPQTILATKYAGAVLTDPFGYPLRLRTAVKLGYKNAKWIRVIEVTNTFRPTFWSKQGENWFAGI